MLSRVYVASGNFVIKHSRHYAADCNAANENIELLAFTWLAHIALAIRVNDLSAIAAVFLFIGVTAVETHAWCRQRNSIVASIASRRGSLFR